MTKKRDNALIEKAMNDIQLIRESMKDNTKDILRSVAVEEIGGIVQESLNEDSEEEEEEEGDFGMDTETDGKETDLEVDTPDEEEESSEDFTADDESEGEVDIDATDFGTDDLADTESSEADYEEEEDTPLEYDYTSASDEEVVSVFKKLTDTDEIDIVDDSEVHITDPESGSEYQVKLKNSEPTEEVAPSIADDATPEIGVEDEYEDDESEYEISLGDDDELDLDDDDEENVREDIVRGQGHDTHAKEITNSSGNVEVNEPQDGSEVGDNLEGGFDDDAVSHADAEGPMVMEKEDEEDTEELEEAEDEVEEAISVGSAQAQRAPGRAKNGAPKGPGADALSESKEYKVLKQNYNKVAKQNESFKSALKELRKMLNEVATYNSNLTYATRLFTEHSTTKEEKRKILEKFDNEATTLKESKKVYKSLVGNFTKKPNLQESVGKKLNDNEKFSSKSNINESTSYEDNQTVRMKQLMGFN